MNGPDSAQSEIGLGFGRMSHVWKDEALQQAQTPASTIHVTVADFGSRYEVETVLS